MTRTRPLSRIVLVAIVIRGNAGKVNTIPRIEIIYNEKVDN